MSRSLRVLLVFVFLVSSVFAADRGSLIRQANIYLSPDAKSAKLGEVERGRELSFSRIDPRLGPRHGDARRRKNRDGVDAG